MSKTPTLDIKSNKPYYTVPAIQNTVVEDGTTFYICEGDRKFVASEYDKNFLVTRGKVLPKHFRGDGELGRTGQRKGTGMDLRLAKMPVKTKSR